MQGTLLSLVQDGAWQGSGGGSPPHPHLSLQEKFSSDAISSLTDILIQAKMNADNNNSSEDQASNAFSDRHILSTVADIFGAGIETTVSVLRWIVAFLLHNPEVSEYLLSLVFLWNPTSPILGGWGAMPGALCADNPAPPLIQAVANSDPGLMLPHLLETRLRLQSHHWIESCRDCDRWALLSPPPS